MATGRRRGDHRIPLTGRLTVTTRSGHDAESRPGATSACRWRCGATLGRMLAWSAEVWTAIAACAQALGVLGALWYAASQISAAKDLARLQRREQVRDQLDQVWFIEVDVAFRQVRVLRRRLADPSTSEELAEAAIEASRVLTNACSPGHVGSSSSSRGARPSRPADQGDPTVEPEAAMSIGEVDVLALRQAVNEVVLDLLEVVPLSNSGPPTNSDSHPPSAGAVGTSSPGDRWRSVSPHTSSTTSR